MSERESDESERRLDRAVRGSQGEHDEQPDPDEREELQSEIGGQTVGGSGEARTLGHGTSGGDDYTAINTGGTSVNDSEQD